VVWAQRSNLVFVTIELADAQDVKMEYTPEGKLTFAATAGGCPTPSTGSSMISSTSQCVPQSLPSVPQPLPSVPSAPCMDIWLLVPTRLFCSGDRSLPFGQSGEVR